jgi:tripeptidyl-peptidase-1
VKAWLVGSGIPEDSISLSHNKAWIQFDAPAQDVEQLIGAQYHYYEHSGSDRKHIGCDEYKVPHQVAGHIDFVTPGVKFVATNGMSELKKRGLPSSSRVAVSRPVPADVLARIQKNPRMYCLSKGLEFTL